MELHAIHDELVVAVAIMDEKGEENRHACMTLWLSEWQRLRDTLVKCLDGVKSALAVMEAPDA